MISASSVTRPHVRAGNGRSNRDRSNTPPCPRRSRREPHDTHLGAGVSRTESDAGPDRRAPRNRDVSRSIATSSSRLAGFVIRTFAHPWDCKRGADAAGCYGCFAAPATRPSVEVCSGAGTSPAPATRQRYRPSCSASRLAAGGSSLAIASMYASILWKLNRVRVQSPFNQPKSELSQCCQPHWLQLEPSK